MRFCKGCGDGKDWCNGRGKQGKDALSVCAKGLCKDAKPTKHTQTLTLQKAQCDNRTNTHSPHPTNIPIICHNSPKITNTFSN